MKKSSRPQQILGQWGELSTLCTDRESQRRLMVLYRHLTHRTEKIAETSSQAEVETAHFLTQAGFSVAFLEAAGGRTADLQCYSGGHRFFVEITVIQSTPSSFHHRRHTRAASTILLETEDDIFEQAFVRRLLARMAEKAKQMDRYCAPVLLAVSVPDVPMERPQYSSFVPLDPQRIAGMVVGVLAEMPQFSGLLLTVWKAPTQELRNPIRIRQVHWVTRPPNQTRRPRIRLLATNPYARYRLTAGEIRLIKEAL